MCVYLDYTRAYIKICLTFKPEKSILFKITIVLNDFTFITNDKQNTCEWGIFFKNFKLYTKI